MAEDNKIINRKLFSKNDLILAAIFILAGSLMFLLNISGNKEGELTAIIYENGRRISSINLEDVRKSYNIILNEANNLVIRVEKRRIRYLSSNCHDKICVNTGWLDDYGDFASCAPYRSAIILTGKENNKPDIILS